MNMTPEVLRAKYGDEVVLGVDKSIVDGRLQSGYTPLQNPANGSAPLLRQLADHLRPRLRCEAELDASFKQLIPYVLLRNAANGHIYATTRLGGDSRLVGQVSIGLGGHMEAGESFVTCLFRELKEEIGLTEGDVVVLSFLGFIFSEGSDVDSVHLGLVYEMETLRTDIICLEADKQIGAWHSTDELAAARSQGRMEFWSEIVFDALFLERHHVKPVCDICGKQAPVRVACSAYGPISFGYCDDCLNKNLEPYNAVVAYVACAGRFPDEINEAYRHDIRRMLSLWNKTEEEFIRDVNAAIKEMEGCE